MVQCALGRYVFVVSSLDRFLHRLPTSAASPSFTAARLNWCLAFSTWHLASSGRAATPCDGLGRERESAAENVESIPVSIHSRCRPTYLPSVYQATSSLLWRNSFLEKIRRRQFCEAAKFCASKQIHQFLSILTNVRIALTTNYLRILRHCFAYLLLENFECFEQLNFTNGFVSCI